MSDASARRLPAVLVAIAGLAVLPTAAGAPDGGASARAGSCLGHRVTISGTNGRDTLRGTAHTDVIDGKAGSDDIDAKQGDDFICGRDGHDELHGGNEIDDIDGGAGDDFIDGRRDGKGRMTGGPGEDHIIGGSVLFGGKGNDTVDAYTYVNFRSRKMYGGEGDDLMFGSSHDQKMYGGDGADDMDGSSDDDELYGEGDNDDLDGGPDTDICEQGLGTGTVVNCE